MNDYYSFEDIHRAGKVVSIGAVEKILQTTEPVEQRVLTTDGTSKVKVSLPDHWNLDLKELDDGTITSCTIEVDGDRFYLSKRAVLSLLSMIGISDRYAYKTPGFLLEPHVNYWFEHEGVGPDADLKLITKDEYAVGFMRTFQQVVSNLKVLEQVKKYFINNKIKGELFVDPQIVHNYVQTEFRIILPEVAFTVNTTRNGVEETDKWHFGIMISNSLTSSLNKPLTISGYMLEEKSLAGILPEYSHISGYTRHVDMDVEDLNGWVHSTLDQIFSILPAEAEMIAHMPEHSLVGKVGPITSDIFRSMKVHRKVQEIALENLTVSGDMTSYGIMHSMATAVTNSGYKFAPKVVNHIQQVCGSLPARSEEICDSCGRLHLVS